MSNIDNITNKILERAKNEVQGILNEAEAKRVSILESNESKTAEAVNNIIKEAEKEGELLDSRILESSKLKARDISLKAKEELINKVITQVKKSLMGLDDESYMEFLKNNLKALDLKKNAVLTVPKDKRALVEKENLGIKLSDKNIDSGFSLSNDKVVYNFEFSNFVDSIRESLETEIVEKLFER